MFKNFFIHNFAIMILFVAKTVILSPDKIGEKNLFSSTNNRFFSRKLLQKDKSLWLFKSSIEISFELSRLLMSKYIKYTH